MDGLPYWKFFSDKWLAGNIQAHDMQTQGIYINLCARTWADGGEIEYNIERLSRVLHIDKQVLEVAMQLLIDDEIIVITKSGNLTTKFILQQLADRKKLSKKRANNGRKGGNAKQLARVSKCQAKGKQNLAILEVEVEPEIEVESDLKTNTKKRTFISFGEFENVKLTEEEYSKLTAVHGDDITKAGIETLGAWLKSTGKRRRDHYACLNASSWVWEKVGGGKEKKFTSKFK